MNPSEKQKPLDKYSQQWINPSEESIMSLAMNDPLPAPRFKNIPRLFTICGKPRCFKCDLEIGCKYVKLDEQIYLHRDCFNCTCCNRSLDSYANGYLIINRRLYCMLDGRHTVIVFLRSNVRIQLRSYRPLRPPKTEAVQWPL